MVRYEQHCPACDWTGEVVVEPGAKVPCPVCNEETERIWRGDVTVQDDTLPGGPRWIENLDHTPIWVETKTQFQQELDKRDVRLKESPNRNRKDRSPWATQTTLTADAADDPHLQQVAAEIRRPRLVRPDAPPVVLPPGIKRLQLAEVLLICHADQLAREMGIQFIFDCRTCARNGSPARVVAHNLRGAADWRMRCAHQEWRFWPEKES